MAFSSRLGVSPNAYLGNIELGTTDTLTSPTTITVPSTQYFTGILGLSRSLLSKIVLGRAFMRLVASPAQTANLSFVASLLLDLANRLQFTSSTTVITQARRLALKVVQRTTTQLDTLPSSIDVDRKELYPISIDFTQYVGSGDTVSTPTATMLQQPNAIVVPTTSWLVGNAMSVSGNTVQVPINTSILQLSQSYVLSVTVRLNTNKTLTSTTTINVVN